MTQKRKPAKIIKSKDNDETSVKPRDEIEEPLDNNEDDEDQMNPIPAPWSPPLGGLSKEQWPPNKDEPLEIDLTKTEGFPPLRIVDKDKPVVFPLPNEYLTLPDPDIGDEEQGGEMPITLDDRRGPKFDNRGPTDMTSVTVSAISLGMLKTNKALFNYLLRCELNNDQVLLLTSMITNYLFEVKIMKTTSIGVNPPFNTFFYNRCKDLYPNTNSFDNPPDIVVRKLSDLLDRSR